MGDVAGTPATVGSSVPASGTRGCSGSEDGLEDGHAALNHRLEESDRLGEEFVSEAQRVPGAGPRVAIQSLSESLRREEEG